MSGFCALNLPPHLSDLPIEIFVFACHLKMQVSTAHANGFCYFIADADLTAGFVLSWHQGVGPAELALVR